MRGSGVKSGQGQYKVLYCYIYEYYCPIPFPICAAGTRVLPSHCGAAKHSMLSHATRLLLRTQGVPATQCSLVLINCNRGRIRVRSGLRGGVLGKAGDGYILCHPPGLAMPP